MALAGYSASFKAAGTAVPVTSEATTSLGSGVYRVTSATRRIWDPSVTVTVRDGGTSVSSTLWSFDYLFGRVTFSGYTPTGAVTVDGSYLPTVTVAECRSITVRGEAGTVDATTFDVSNGYTTKAPTLKSSSGSAEILSKTVTPLVGSVSLDTILSSGSPYLFEFGFGGVAFFRGWYLLEQLETSASATDLVAATVSMVSAPVRAGAACGFGT